jgi:hypothetical protein
MGIKKKHSLLERFITRIETDTSVIFQLKGKPEYPIGVVKVVRPLEYSKMMGAKDSIIESQKSEIERLKIIISDKESIISDKDCNIRTLQNQIEDLEDEIRLESMTQPKPKELT